MPIYNSKHKGIDIDNAVDRVKADVSITFNNVADMKAASFLKVGDKVRTLGYYEAGDGGGCDYVIIAGLSGTNVGFLHENLNIGGNQAKLIGGGLIESKVINIPSDFEDIQKAANFLIKTIKNATSNVNISLLIQSNHKIKTGLSLKNQNLGYCSIDSVDSVVYLADDYQPQPVSGLSLGLNAIFFADNSKMPTIAVMVDAEDNQIAGHGCYYFRGSSGIVSSKNGGCGVDNAYGSGLYVENSDVYAHGTNFRGARQFGLRATVAAKVTAQDIDVSSQKGGYGGDIYGAMDISRGSLVNIRSQNRVTNLSNCVGWGLYVRRSFVSANGIAINNTQYRAVWIRQGSVVTISNASLSRAVGNTANLIQCEEGATIDASNVTNNGQPLSRIDTNVTNFNLPSVNGTIYCGSLAAVSNGASTSTRGFFARRADFIQECWVTRSAEFVSSSVLRFTWTYAQPFENIEDVVFSLSIKGPIVMSADAAKEFYLRVSTTSFTNESCRVEVISPSNLFVAGDNVTISTRAIGKFTI
jgi:hypothetical protein